MCAICQFPWCQHSYCNATARGAGKPCTWLALWSTCCCTCVVQRPPQSGLQGNCPISVGVMAQRKYEAGPVPSPLLCTNAQISCLDGQQALTGHLLCVWLCVRPCRFRSGPDRHSPDLLGAGYQVQFNRILLSGGWVICSSIPNQLNGNPFFPPLRTCNFPTQHLEHQGYQIIFPFPKHL